MNVIILTGKSIHHKFLCSEIAKRHNVVGIFHPAIQKKSFTKKMLQLSKEIKDNKLMYTLLRLAQKKIGYNYPQDQQNTGVEFLKTDAKAYEKIDPAIITHVENINSKNSICKIQDLHHDVVICLGGWIYRKPLIDA